jgi:hypothetical protein
MAMFVRRLEMHILSALRGIYCTKNVIKSSERLDSCMLSPTEAFSSNSRSGFFRCLTGLTPDTSTLSPTEEFTSNFWWNFSHYLTGTDPRYLDRYILSPREEFTSLFWSNFFQYLIGSDPLPSTISQTEEFPPNFQWGFFHCLNGTNPRYFDGRTISLSLSCQIHAARNKREICSDFKDDFM